MVQRSGSTQIAGFHATIAHEQHKKETNQDNTAAAVLPGIGAFHEKNKKIANNPLLREPGLHNLIGNIKTLIREEEQE